MSVFPALVNMAESVKIYLDHSSAAAPLDGLDSTAILVCKAWLLHIFKLQAWL